MNAIEIEGLGKQYRIRTPGGRHRTLRDAVAGTLTGAVAGLRDRLTRTGGGRSDSEYFWALTELTLDVRAGEALGIIGPNGAGKSTLLKLLCRITEPTTGIARVRGRVGSLLEVGTGFHSELTGRENTYMSGAILGMSRAEIDRKFEEIVEFSGIGQFIDTPAKHYSSGMYLRLAFAVAAHLEPDILIVDEVLAVGDAEFQRKCLGKLEEVRQETGRTVCFVSHNLAAVQRLCDRAILLRQGRLVASGSPAEMTKAYLESGATHSAPGTWEPTLAVPRRGTGGCRFEAVWYSSGAADAAGHPYTDGPLEVRLRIRAEAATAPRSCGIIFANEHGTRLINADTVSLERPLRLQPGLNEVRFQIAALHLTPGRYTLGLRITDAAGIVQDYTESAIDLEVVGPPGPPRPRPDWDGAVSCRFQAEVWE
jgi:lipopolysaccharide transport system ATP-binding protein